MLGPCAPPRSSLAGLAWRGAIKVLALTGAIVSAVVALILLQEAVRFGLARDSSLHHAFFCLGHGLGLALAAVLLLSSSLRASAGRLGLGVLVVAALIAI